jgi:C4-dicarboxylate transporter DctM subunit
MTGYGQGPRGICILFVIQAQAPDVEITSIYRGIIPFLIAPLILIVLMFLFPGLALWLPKALYG